MLDEAGELCNDGVLTDRLALFVNQVPGTSNGDFWRKLVVEVPGTL